MTKIWLIAGALHGFLAVALGAFGAHGLRSKLEPLEDGAKRLANWETAAHYQLTHALAIFAALWLATRVDSALPSYAAGAFSLGALIFSGSLYLYSLTGTKLFGAITPIGGLGLLAGWVCVLLAALRYSGE